MTRLGLCSVALVWLIAAARSAHAASPEPNEPRFSDRPISLEARSGVSTSVGLLGVVAELTPIDRLSFGGGIGNNGLGPIWGLHLRARPVLFGADRHGNIAALTLEGAYSRGRYEGFDLTGVMASLCEGESPDPNDGCYSVQVIARTVSWGQLELGGELRFWSGVSLRASLGIATALGSPDWQCLHDGQTNSCGSKAPASTLPVATLAVGYAF